MLQESNAEDRQASSATISEMPLHGKHFDVGQKQSGRDDMIGIKNF
jgi:hypothetical protein